MSAPTNPTANQAGAGPTNGGNGRPVDLVAIESALIQMKGLNDLAGWISRARDFIEGIETGRRLSPEFAHQLELRDFSAAGIDWDEDVADGMHCLHSALAENMRAIGLASNLRPATTA